MKRQLFLLLIATLSGLASISISVGQEAAPPRRMALIVQAYRQVPDLKDDLAAQTAAGFTNGSRDLAKELLRHGWDARLWASRRPSAPPPPADETPTEAKLRDQLKTLAGLHQDAQVLVVLVGPLIALEGEGQRLYFCPQDAEYAGLVKADDVKAKHHLLSLEDIYGCLKACPARKKLLVLVTALSSTYWPKKYPPPLCARLPKLPAPPAGLAVLTSCAEGEFTSDNAHFLDELREGLAGLKADGAPDGKHPDGAVTAAELIAYAQPRVRKTASNYGSWSFPQNPSVLGRLPRDWVVVGKAAGSRWKLLTVPFPAKEAQQRQAEVAHALKLEAPVLNTTVGMMLAVVPPGEVKLGSDKGYEDERPLPTVRLARPFLLGQHEVTQAQYEKVMGDNPSHFRAVPGQDTSAFPVERVSFKQAVLFCNALSELEKLTPYYRLLQPRKDVKTGRVVDFQDYVPTGGRGYRLPTEAEWEWACRAGTDTQFSFGEALTGKQANIDAGRPGGIEDGSYLGRPTKVGSYAPNAWGLFDMHGNVAERVEESYDPRRYKELAEAVTDGSGGVGYGGLARGGAWNFAARDCRSAVRLALPPHTAHRFVGLRVARDAE